MNTQKLILTLVLLIILFAGSLPVSAQFKINSSGNIELEGATGGLENN